ATPLSTSPRPAPFAPPPKPAPKPVFKPLLAPKPGHAQGGGDSLPDQTSDVRKSARLPSGIGSLAGKTATSAEIEKMSFKEKQKYFELVKDAASSHSQAKHFSYLSEHELATMRQEEAKKVGGMTQAEILSYVAGSAADVTPDHDLEQVLSRIGYVTLDLLHLSTGCGAAGRTGFRTSPHASREGSQPRTEDVMSAREREAEKRASWRRARMKSLEADAVQAQAVIARAQEMSRDTSSGVRAVDIVFADGEQSHRPSHNGDSRLTLSVCPERASVLFSRNILLYDVISVALHRR
ncbi:unnamed protein product, partial [Candidula unifasciata]